MTKKENAIIAASLAYLQFGMDAGLFKTEDLKKSFGIDGLTSDEVAKIFHLFKDRAIKGEPHG